MIRLFCLIGLLLAAGCTPSGMQLWQPSSGEAEPADLGLPRTPPLKLQSHLLVSTQWLAENLHDPHLVVIHVGRRPVHGADAAVPASRVPGARFVPWSELVDGEDGRMPPLRELVALARRCGITHRSRVVVYDDGVGLAAARMFVILDYLGVGERASLLNGQWAKWRAEQHPMAFGEPVATQPSGFVPRPRPEVIITLSLMRDLVWARTSLPDPPIAIIDARPAEEFAGATPGQGVLRPGHIPGSANVFSLRNIADEQMPVLKSPDELRAIYSRAGAMPGALLVAYCRTGAQSSMTYFVARYLGYDVRLYDGSYLEWSSVPDAPIVGPCDGPDVVGDAPEKV